MNKTIDELTAAVKAAIPHFLAIGSQEAPEAYKRRLIKAAADLPDADWEALSDDAKHTFNDVLREIQEESPARQPSGYRHKVRRSRLPGRKPA